MTFIYFLVWLFSGVPNIIDGHHTSWLIALVFCLVLDGVGSSR